MPMLVEHGPQLRPVYGASGSYPTWFCNALVADLVCGITPLAHISLVYLLLEELSELALVLGQTELATDRALVCELNLR